MYFLFSFFRMRRRCGSGPPAAVSLDQRQYVELVERRGRRQGPFEGGRARSPWIVRRSLLADEGAHHSVEEDQHADAGDIRSERGHHVPAMVGIGIVDVA